MATTSKVSDLLGELCSLQLLQAQETLYLLKVPLLFGAVGEKFSFPT
jgi:hypothetical protein